MLGRLLTEINKGEEIIWSCYLSAKRKSKPTDQLILDYDYAFITPYCRSTGIEMNPETGRRASEENNRSLHWEDCQEQIDTVALAAKEPILFYDEIGLYEDALYDNGISLLTVKVGEYKTDCFSRKLLEGSNISYLVIYAAARNQPSAESLSRITRAAKAVAHMALLVKDLTDAICWTGDTFGKPPNVETVNKVKRGATAVADASLLVKEWADASYRLGDALGRPASRETDNAGE